MMPYITASDASFPRQGLAWCAQPFHDTERWVSFAGRHWFGDVTGGALLALAILSIAGVTPLGRSTR
jgi:hypothetical protein